MSSLPTPRAIPTSGSRAGSRSPTGACNKDIEREDAMTRFALSATTALVVCFAFGGLQAALAADSALIGKVTSVEEGAMEGVVVSARKEGSTIRISVVTDAQGHFSFPAAKLEPGRYTISIRAAGYVLARPPRPPGHQNRGGEHHPHPRSKTKEDAKPRGPAPQRGLDVDPPRRARAPGARELHHLPHRAAGARLDPHGRRFHEFDPAHDALW